MNFLIKQNNSLAEQNPEKALENWLKELNISESFKNWMKGLWHICRKLEREWGLEENYLEIFLDPTEPFAHVAVKTKRYPLNRADVDRPEKRKEMKDVIEQSQFIHLEKEFVWALSLKALKAQRMTKESLSHSEYSLEKIWKELNTRGFTSCGVLPGYKRRKYPALNPSIPTNFLGEI